MYFQVVFGFFIFFFASTTAVDQYYLNGDTSTADQHFFYNFQPRQYTYYPNDLNKPVFIPQMGMSPQYHDLVFNYVKDFAGTEPPTQVSTFQPNIFYNDGQVLSQGIPDGEKFSQQKEITSTNKPGQNDYFLPSDLLSLNNDPANQFYGHLNAIKIKRINPKSQPTSIPPLGGVVSNYVLLRHFSNPQNSLQTPGTVKAKESSLQHIKRQIPNDTEGIEILAEPLQNSKMSEENEKKKQEEEQNNKEEDQTDVNPGIAQSKPSAIALAGPGGMAQASPVGTALVGQGGLAVAAPSGTAVAGPAGQGAIPIQIGGEKQKTTEKSEKNENNEEESDFY